MTAMTEPFTIARRPIGPDQPPYVIAELGNNHGGDGAVAKRMLHAAAEAGADAIKLQTFVPAKFVARSSAYFERLSRGVLPRETIAELAATARQIGAVLFSAVFDEESADAWADLDAPVFKMASGDLTHLPLMRHVAAYGKPMIVSTGGATMDDIAAALAAIRETGPDTPVALLHCVSNYPTVPAQANLACMATMRAAFGVPVGFSDHTIGNATSLAAAAAGAEIIEKHFTLDRMAEGPDHKLSAEPADLAQLVDGVRLAHAMRGRAEKAPVEAADFIPLIRRSVTADVVISAGTTIEAGMLAIKRPGTGIAPAQLDDVIGRRAARDIAADETLEWDCLEPGDAPA